MTLLADAACHPQLRDACVPPPQVLLREHRLRLGQNFLVCAIFCCNIAKNKKNGARCYAYVNTYNSYYLILRESSVE